MLDRQHHSCFAAQAPPICSDRMVPHHNTPSCVACTALRHATHGVHSTKEHCQRLSPHAGAHKQVYLYGTHQHAHQILQSSVIRVCSCGGIALTCGNCGMTWCKDIWCHAQGLGWGVLSCGPHTRQKTPGHMATCAMCLATCHVAHSICSSIRLCTCLAPLNKFIHGATLVMSIIAAVVNMPLLHTPELPRNRACAGRGDIMCVQILSACQQHAHLRGDIMCVQLLHACHQHRLVQSIAPYTQCVAHNFVEPLRLKVPHQFPSILHERVLRK